MPDKNTKAQIRQTKDFIELWVKFHDLYKNATKKETITEEEEALFLETKSLIADKYSKLKDSLGSKRGRDNEMLDVISHVLSLKGMSAMSDKVLNKIDRSWDHSYVVLNKMLKDLEDENTKMPAERPVLKFLTGLFYMKIVQIPIIGLLIFIMFYSIYLVLLMFTAK